MKINKHILSNGLRLIHFEDKSTQMVAINTLYDVGARDESPEKTGLAHLFEHLMFGGTERVPDFDAVVQKAGGENNAWTTNDITNYYITLSKQNAEIGFWLEADRMYGIDFLQHNLDNQKMVVIEEFKQRNLNQPYGDVSALIREMAYKVHPYRWATIGKEISHIESVTIEDVKDFFYTYYIPSNAILSVTGNISFETAVKFAEKYYSKIPSGKKPIRNLPKEPLQTEARTLIVERNVPVDAFYRVYKMNARRDKGYIVCDLISDILANGASARLRQSLIKEQKIAVEINAYVSGDIDEGLFYIVGKPTEDHSIFDIEKAVEKELNKLISEKVSEQELVKVKNKYESNKVFSDMNYLNRASVLAFQELIDRAENYPQDLKNYLAIIPGQIQEKAAGIFIPEQSSTLYYKKG
jgi:predicted Zn-dependent peptidase